MDYLAKGQNERVGEHADHWECVDDQGDFFKFFRFVKNNATHNWADHSGDHEQEAQQTDFWALILKYLNHFF